MTQATRERSGMRQRCTALACIALLGAAPVAQAAQQCFDRAGTFGGLTVTTSGPGCGTFLAFGGITGVWMGDTNATENCTFNVSPAVVGNTIQVTLTAHSCNNTTFCEEARFSLNGTHYVVQPADLVTPSSGGGSPVQITGAGDIVESPGGSSAGSGVVTFHNAPPSVSSIDINHVVTLGAPAGTIYLVCANDTGAGAPTTTALTSSVNPSTVGQAVTLTATVTGGSPTGTVQFVDGSTNLGAPVALVGNVATLVTSSLTAGTHSITAVYGGDVDDAASTSAPLSQVVNGAVATAILPVPTLSEWALLLLAAMLGGLGIARRRR